MTFSSLRLALIAGLVLPLGLASASLAQSGPPDAAPANAGHDGHWGDPAARAAHMAQHLRDALQLQPSQEPALDALLASMKPPEGGPGGMMHHDHDMGADAGLTTPQRLDKMLARMDEMHARFAQHAAAVKAFYAQLSPSQQKAFDAMAPMMMMHGMGHHHMGPGGMMGGPRGPHPDGGGPDQSGPDGQPHG